MNIKEMPKWLNVMETMVRKNGVNTYGIQEATFNENRGNLPKNVTWRNANQKQMNQVLQNTLKSKAALLDKVTNNGFSSRDEDDQNSVMLAAWAFGTSPRTFGVVRDVLANNGSKTELAKALSSLEPLKKEHAKGYDNRKAYSIPTIFGSYEHLENKKALDSFRQRVEAKGDVKKYVYDNCEIMERCQGVFNEQLSQEANAGVAINNHKPTKSVQESVSNKKQGNSIQTSEKPQEEGFLASLGRNVIDFISSFTNKQKNDNMNTKGGQ